MSFNSLNCHAMCVPLYLSEFVHEECDIVRYKYAKCRCYTMLQMSSNDIDI